MDGMRKMNSDGYEEAYMNVNSQEKGVKEEKNQSDKKMPFHLTITNNETGETEFDFDFEAIIGGVIEENGNRAMALTDCGPYELATAIRRAERAAKMMREKHPGIVVLVDMAHEIVRGTPKTEETENK